MRGPLGASKYLQVSAILRALRDTSTFLGGNFKKRGLRTSTALMCVMAHRLTDRQTDDMNQTCTITPALPNERYCTDFVELSNRKFGYLEQIHVQIPYVLLMFNVHIRLSTLKIRSKCPTVKCPVMFVCFFRPTCTVLFTSRNLWHHEGTREPSFHLSSSKRAYRIAFLSNKQHDPLITSEGGFLVSFACWTKTKPKISENNNNKGIIKKTKKRLQQHSCVKEER